MTSPVLGSICWTRPIVATVRQNANFPPPSNIPTEKFGDRTSRPCIVLEHLASDLFAIALTYTWDGKGIKGSSTPTSQHKLFLPIAPAEPTKHQLYQLSLESLPAKPWKASNAGLDATFTVHRKLLEPYDTQFGWTRLDKASRSVLWRLYTLKPDFIDAVEAIFPAAQLAGKTKADVTIQLPKVKGSSDLKIQNPDHLDISTIEEWQDETSRYLVDYADGDEGPVIRLRLLRKDIERLQLSIRRAWKDAAGKTLSRKDDKEVVDVKSSSDEKALSVSQIDKGLDTMSKKLNHKDDKDMVSSKGDEEEKSLSVSQIDRALGKMSKKPAGTARALRPEKEHLVMVIRTKERALATPTTPKGNPALSNVGSQAPSRALNADVEVQVSSTDETQKSPLRDNTAASAIKGSALRFCAPRATTPDGVASLLSTIKPFVSAGSTTPTSSPAAVIFGSEQARTATALTPDAPSIVDFSAFRAAAAPKSVESDVNAAKYQLLASATDAAPRTNDKKSTDKDNTLPLSPVARVTHFTDQVALASASSTTGRRSSRKSTACTASVPGKRNPRPKLKICRPGWRKSRLL